MSARLVWDCFMGFKECKDRRLAQNRRLARCYEDGDRVGAGALAEQRAVVFVDRHLPSDEVDAQLGEPLPYASRRRTPLGLP
jgi:hypothetical protein